MSVVAESSTKLAEIESDGLDVSDTVLLYVVPPAAAKIQPNDPRLVEFAPAYHVLVKLYARTLEIDR